MKFFLDTEFVDRPFAIELISIGIVAEDGRELYFENKEADLSLIDDWHRLHVIPTMVGGECLASKETIKQAIISFVGDPMEDPPEFWAFYGDYDWVGFCGLFGRMLDLPKGYPHYCKDFKQYIDDRGISKKSLPTQRGSQHNALKDARWLLEAYKAAAQA